MKSPEAGAKEAEQQRIALMLKTSGHSYPQIAQHLGVEIATAKRITHRALDDYRIRTLEDVDLYAAQIVAAWERADRVWSPRALGGTVVNPDGTTTRIEPDGKAFREWRQMQADRARFANFGRPQRLEITGDAGGPIVTAQVDPMDTIRAIRADLLARVHGKPNGASPQGDAGSNGTNGTNGHG